MGALHYRKFGPVLSRFSAQILHCPPFQACSTFSQNKCCSSQISYTSSRLSSLNKAYIDAAVDTGERLHQRMAKMQTNVRSHQWRISAAPVWPCDEMREFLKLLLAAGFLSRIYQDVRSRWWTLVRKIATGRSFSKKGV